MRVVAVLWPDNTMDVGDDATEILERVRADQFGHCDGREIKVTLAERAQVWSGAWVDPGLDDEAFLDELNRAGLCLVERFDA